MRKKKGQSQEGSSRTNGNEEDMSEQERLSYELRIFPRVLRKRPVPRTQYRREFKRRPGNVARNEKARTSPNGKKKRAIHTTRGYYRGLGVPLKPTLNRGRDGFGHDLKGKPPVSAYGAKGKKCKKGTGRFSGSLCDVKKRDGHQQVVRRDEELHGGSSQKSPGGVRTERVQDCGLVQRRRKHKTKGGEIKNFNYNAGSGR